MERRIFIVGGALYNTQCTQLQLIQDLFRPRTCSVGRTTVTVVNINTKRPRQFADIYAQIIGMVENAERSGVRSGSRY